MNHYESTGQTKLDLPQITSIWVPFSARNAPEERARKAHAAGLPPSAAAAAAAEALKREAAPAEVQITVAVLGHQGQSVRSENPLEGLRERRKRWFYNVLQLYTPFGHIIHRAQFWLLLIECPGQSHLVIYFVNSKTLWRLNRKPSILGSGSGKSTLVGALLLATGTISERDLVKRRKDSSLHGCLHTHIQFNLTQGIQQGQ